MQEATDFLHECGVFYLATTDGTTPHVRPFGIAEIVDGRLYLMTRKSKNVYRQLKQNPLAELCAMKGDGSWVRISGSLIEDDSVSVAEAVLSLRPDMRSIYTPGDPDVTSFYLTGGMASYSTESPEPRVVKF